jgi:hypothetical protein
MRPLSASCNHFIAIQKRKESTPLQMRVARSTLAVPEGEDFFAAEEIWGLSKGGGSSWHRVALDLEAS